MAQRRVGVVGLLGLHEQERCHRADEPGAGDAEPRTSSQKCVMENCSRSTMRARKYDAWYSIAFPDTWNAGYIA